MSRRTQPPAVRRRRGWALASAWLLAALMALGMLLPYVAEPGLSKLDQALMVHVIGTWLALLAVARPGLCDRPPDAGRGPLALVRDPNAQPLAPATGNG